MRIPLRFLMLSAVFGQNYLVYYWSGQQALASHWPEEFLNSTPAYLIIGQSDAVWY